PDCVIELNQPPSRSNGVKYSHPSQPPATTNASHGSGAARFLSRGRNSSAVSAGLSVNELNVEITIDTAIVSANCRKNCPMMPVMNAHGTNTALSTSPTAITGPDTCSMALIVASRGDNPCSI